jgi:hypothetical protein
VALVVVLNLPQHHEAASIAPDRQRVESAGQPLLAKSGGSPKPCRQMIHFLPSPISNIKQRRTRISHKLKANKNQRRKTAGFSFLSLKFNS